MDEVGYTMEDDEDRELEHYVWQHKHETLRSIQEGMEKEFGRTKSTKWIRPRREEARQVEETPEVEVVLPKDEEIIDEGEKKERAEKEEDRYEEDPEIIETNLKITRLKKEQKRVQAQKELQETKNQLALLKEDAKTIEDLKNQIALKTLTKRLREGEIHKLKKTLERIMEESENYYANATCPECEGHFFWKLDDETLICAVCEKQYSIEKE